MPSVSGHPFDAYHGTEPFIFVSYSHQDGAEVFPDINRLNQLGYRIWYDEGIDPGNEWTAEIAQALEAAHSFIVFISSNAVKSTNVRNEINFALNRGKPFLAIHLADIKLPPGLELRMADIQAIYKWQLLDDQYLRKLERSLITSTGKIDANATKEQIKPSIMPSTKGNRQLFWTWGPILAIGIFLIILWSFFWPQSPKESVSTPETRMLLYLAQLDQHEQPQFTSTPDTDTRISQSLLLPLDPIIIYTLFQQGWPVDQLIRVIVERITVPQEDGSVTVYFNTPGSQSYPSFLELCATARELQKDGNLVLVAKKSFVPTVDSGGQPNPPDIKAVLSLETNEPTLTWGRLPNNNWTIGKNVLQPVFVLTKGSDSTFARIGESRGYKGTTNNLKAVFAKGFSIGSYESNSSSLLVLRSLSGILSAAAEEQSEFDQYLQSSALPDIIIIERRPIIRLKWNSQSKLLAPVVALDYRGQHYQITDPETTMLNEDASWNRDVFRLLNQLFSQVVPN